MFESLVQKIFLETPQNYFATANARNNDGQKDPANFALSKSFKLFNPFSTNVSLIDKSGSWFLLAKCLKNTCGRVTF